jgi:hypothetical protein
MYVVFLNWMIASAAQQRTAYEPKKMKQNDKEGFGDWLHPRCVGESFGTNSSNCKKGGSTVRMGSGVS